MDQENGKNYQEKEIPSRINILECRRGAGLSSIMKEKLSQLLLSKQKSKKNRTRKIKNECDDKRMTNKCTKQIKGTSRISSKKETVKKIRCYKKRTLEERLSIIKIFRDAFKCRNRRANNRRLGNIERGYKLSKG